MWKTWTRQERYLVSQSSNRSWRLQFKAWRVEELFSQATQDSYVKDLTQDGDVEPNPGPRRSPSSCSPHKVKAPCFLNAGTKPELHGSQWDQGYAKNQNGFQYGKMRRWRQQRQKSWPNPLAQQAGAPRATPENREKSGVAQVTLVC